ncbi:MAG TPA: hypothetical protein VFN68_05990 [Acidimicrobiales bacterium]|nr:hypothetical protein [Acidimicrobiales bacterium]
MAFPRFLKDFFKGWEWAPAAGVGPPYYLELFSPPVPGSPAPAGPDAPGVARRRKRRGDPACEAEVVAECEVYLSGEFRGYLEQLGRPVPGWAWVNGLAHGELPLIRRLARGGDPGGSPQAVVADIARQLVSLVERGVDTLEGLQRRILIPLESDLADSRPPVIPADAAQLRRAIDAALRHRTPPGRGNRPGWAR